MESSLILKQEFFNFYPKLLNQLKSSRTLEELPLMRDWVEKVYTQTLFFLFRSDEIKFF